MFKGFRDFVMRGNVLDLAIAVVIGAAFGSVISQLTKSFIEPLIKVFAGGGVKGGAFIVDGVAFDWAAFINALIYFIIVLAILYFLIVVPVNRMRERRQRAQAAGAAPTPVPDDIALLQEIRDLLKPKD